MYQANIDGIKVYRVRVLWNAGNEVCSKFLDKDRWYNLTGYTVGDEKTGDLIDVLCLFGTIAPLYSSAMSYAGTRSDQGMCKVLNQMTRGLQRQKDASGSERRSASCSWVWGESGPKRMVRFDARPEH